MFPMVTPVPSMVHAAFAAGFISTPIASRPTNGPSRSIRASAMATFFMVVASVSAQRLVEERQTQQVARRHRTRSGCFGRALAARRRAFGWAGEEDRERHRMVRSHRFVVPDPFAVPGALDRDGYCPDWELTGAGLLDCLRPLVWYIGVGDHQVLARAVLAQIDPGVTVRQAGGHGARQPCLLVPGRVAHVEQHGGVSQR